MEDKKQFKHTMPVQIRFSDVDQFGHVNNSVYFSLYDLAKTDYLKKVIADTELDTKVVVVANINANFFAPIFFSDQIQIETTTIQLGNSSFTLLQRAVSLDGGYVKCECRTVMVLYDMATKEPMPISDEYRKAICDYEGKMLEELAKN